MVLSWILNSLEPDLANSVIYTDSAHEIWTDLEERFAPRVFQIHKEIATLTQDQMPLSTYYSKLKGYWDELSSYNNMEPCTCGVLKSIAAREEEQHLMQLLMGLHESYAAIRGQILLMQPLPTARKAYNLLLQEEKQRQVASTHNNTANNESMAMLSIHTKKGNTSKQGFQQRPSSSNISPSFQPRGNPREPKQCTYCNSKTHTIDTCFFLKGFPPGHKWHGKEVVPKLDDSGHSSHNRPSHGSNRQYTNVNNVQSPDAQIHHLQTIAPHLTLEQC
ncbi:uncharacterized protein LOC110745013 [Prunus avium]|uniref:Uncharacterized protein LOC110745013 n=1 Tax=Prunus avium TaxID=42229 RepID=A0A6P5RIW1_PRUAV|nr:uncharacterized protein LOC110745013 [Prunus avium]